jgi:general secretion pathway protein G
LKRQKPKKPTGIAFYCALRIRGVLSSSRSRLTSNRSVEITGFTLIELLMVMVIISILATIGYYRYSAFITQTQETRAIADIKQIAQLLEEFNELNGRYPNDLSELNRGEFTDPWGNPYQYVNIVEDGKRGKNDQKGRKDRNQNPINTYFDLWSNGADGDYNKQVTGAKSRDDIIRAWDGSFVGLGKTLDELYGKPRPWRHPADDTPDEETPPAKTPKKEK